VDTLVSGFWSDFGCDGLSLGFDGALADPQRLAEAQQMAPFRLADAAHDPLQAPVQALAASPAARRLAALNDLSARLSE
jgi:hypothetical protein